MTSHSNTVARKPHHQNARNFTSSQSGRKFKNYDKLSEKVLPSFNLGLLELTASYFSKAQPGSCKLSCNPPHLHQARTIQYWVHEIRYECNRGVSLKLLCRSKGMLAHNSINSLVHTYDDARRPVAALRTQRSMIGI
eukprot:366933-Pelagomonas_calceolata.AAC.3